MEFRFFLKPSFWVRYIQWKHLGPDFGTYFIVFGRVLRELVSDI